MNYKKWLKLQDKYKQFDFTDKTANIDLMTSYMFARTQSMFKYDGLPDTIPARILELYLQINGNVCITEISQDIIDQLPESKRETTKPGLYVFTGGMGGELDQYYMPTIYTVANPWLIYSKNLRIGVDCIVIPSDSLYLGLYPMYTKYATGLTENELSLYIAMINSRVSSLVSASDDNTKKSAEKFFSDMKDGKQGVIAENAFLDGIKAQPYGNSGTASTIEQIIETEQYIKASWYNELGLNSNFNMKREALNANETLMNNDVLLPLVDDMLNNRKRGIDAVNKKYGTNITVDLNSSWEDNAEEIELEHDKITDDNGEGVADEQTDND